MTHYGRGAKHIPERLKGNEALLRASLVSVKRPAYGQDNAVLAALREGHREFLRVAIARTRSIAVGEELVEQFYGEAKRTHSAIKELGGLRGWLIRALRRTLAGYQQREQARGTVGYESPDVDEPLPMFLDDVERAVSGCLYRILPTLPSDCSWLIWQIDLLGQPFDRIARTLGITADKLAMRLGRARQSLCAVLERFGMTCPNHGLLNCMCEHSLEGGQGFKSSVASSLHRTP